MFSKFQGCKPQKKNTSCSQTHKSCMNPGSLISRISIHRFRRKNQQAPTKNGLGSRPADISEPFKIFSACHGGVRGRLITMYLDEICWCIFCIKMEFNMNMCMMNVSMYGTRTSRIDWKQNHEKKIDQQKSLNFPMNPSRKWATSKSFN